VANVGGCIQLCGTYLGLTDQDIEQKINDIETTMAQVLHDAESMPSTFAAALALVRRRITEGGKPAKEQVHAH
jgi:hypothetical protein